jgi:hypothetical protein
LDQNITQTAARVLPMVLPILEKKSNVAQYYR